MADSREVQFQQDIIAALISQGWLTGPASGYDRRTALYTEDFLGYFKDAWPERWDKFAKANPEKLTFASPGTGTVSHLVKEAWQKSSGIKITHVPYRGAAQALPDLIGGQVDMYMGSIPTLQSQIKGGKVRAIAVTTHARSALLPDVPTYTESGIPGVELASVWGVMAPTGTPAAIIERFNTEMLKVLKMPDLREKIIASGADMQPSAPQKMGEIYAADRARLAPLVRDSGIKLD